MDFIPSFASLHSMLAEYIPLFRIIWVCTIVVGIVLVGSALVLKRNPERKKLPVVLAIIGALLIVSPLAQLITSFV